MRPDRTSRHEAGPHSSVCRESGNGAINILAREFEDLSISAAPPVRNFQ